MALLFVLREASDWLRGRQSGGFSESHSYNICYHIQRAHTDVFIIMASMKMTVNYQLEKTQEEFPIVIQSYITASIHPSPYSTMWHSFYLSYLSTHLFKKDKVLII